VFSSTATMGDGKILFHADHKNSSSGGATLAEVVGKLLLLMRQQKSSGGEYLALNPGYLIVGPDQEIAARQLVTSVNAATAADVNIYANTLKGVIVDPSIPLKTVYLTGVSAEVDMIEVAWLNGNRGVNIRHRENSNILGVEWDVFMDVGVAPLDFRGLYKGTLT